MSLRHPVCPLCNTHHTFHSRSSLTHCTCNMHEHMSLTYFTCMYFTGNIMSIYYEHIPTYVCISQEYAHNISIHSCIHTCKICQWNMMSRFHWHILHVCMHEWMSLTYFTCMYARAYAHYVRCITHFTHIFPSHISHVTCMSRFNRHILNVCIHEYFTGNCMSIFHSHILHAYMHEHMPFM